MVWVVRVCDVRMNGRMCVCVCVWMVCVVSAFACVIGKCMQKFGHLLSFQNINECHLFLEGSHELCPLLLKLLVLRHQSLHPVLLLLARVLHTHTQSCDIQGVICIIVSH